MKTVCVYHSIDLDGYISAAIVKHWWLKGLSIEGIQFEKDELIANGNITDSIKFIGYNYGQPIPDLSEYDKVIMCDISFPIEEMYNVLVNRIGDKFIWIDHHISAIKDFEVWNKSYGEQHLEGLRDTSFAACELTWSYLFPNEPMPEIVRLLGLYDSFRHKGTYEEEKVLEFQYGARACISNYKEAYNILIESIQTTGELEFMVIDSIHQQGKSIYEYLRTEAKQAYKNGFEINIGNFIEDEYGYSFICINKERFNPINFGIDYHKDGYDGVASFWHANGMWNFSLYNDNGEVDCSLIAKQFGGGGHFSASGMILNNKQFLQLINNK